jgi:hypothetical protein
VCAEADRARSASAARAQSSSLQPIRSHRRSGDECRAPEVRGEIERGDDLVEILPRRNEDELRLRAARDEPLDRGDSALEARPRAHALMDGCGRAVDRDLDAVDGERREAIGASVVDPAPVGLDLDRDPGRGK